MSDTPRTDSQSVKGYETYNTSEYTHKYCAMQLEHELNLARLLLDRVYEVYMSDNTGNDFIDALDPVMHDVAQFCRGTSNPSLQGTGPLVDRTLQGVVRCSSCPECGGELVHTEINDELGDGYRVCRSCGQEWWTDIDYPEHINKKPNPSFQGGEHRTARTERGILRLIAKMVYRKIQQGGASYPAKGTPGKSELGPPCCDIVKT